MDEDVIAPGLTALDWLFAGGVLVLGIVAGRLARALIARRYAQEEGEVGAANPFRRGDQIRTNDIEGRVVDVNFRTVVLVNMDGERVYIPASQVLDEPIFDLTARRRRRTTLEIGVDYATDLPRARDLLLEATCSAEGVLAEPSPEVLVSGFGDSSIDFAVRFWHGSTIGEMWRTRSEVAMAAKAALDGAGIEIPFPQRTLSWRPAEDDGQPDAGSGAP